MRRTLKSKASRDHSTPWCADRSRVSGRFGAIVVYDVRSSARMWYQLRFSINELYHDIGSTQRRQRDGLQLARISICERLHTFDDFLVDVLVEQAHTLVFAQNRVNFID